MLTEFARPTAEHFIELADVIQPFDVWMAPLLREHALALSEIALEDPRSLTCLYGGKVVGIGGVRMDTHEAWQFFAKDCRRSMRAMIEQLRLAVAHHILEFGKIWVTIDPKRPNARRFAAVVGFNLVEGDIWSLTYDELFGEAPCPTS